MEKTVGRSALLNGAVELLQAIDPEGVKAKPVDGPLLVEIGGANKAGKSTIRNLLYDFFRRTGFRAHTLNEAAGIIEVPREDQFYYTMRAGIYNLTNLLDRAWDPRYHIVLFERSVFDNLGWWEVIRREGLITAAERNVMWEFFSQPRLTGLLDAVVYVNCDPEVALSRERTVIQRTGRRMNPETQKVSTESFAAAAKAHGGKFKVFHEFDNTDYEPEDAAAAIGQFLVDALCAREQIRNSA